MTMRKAGVMGWPVAHSLSPKLHGYWLKKYGIEGEYLALEVNPEEFAGKLAALQANGFAGVNLTLPHKELVMSMLADMDSDAQEAGMANTIVIRSDGSFYGMNTDSYGFIENIRGSIPQKNKAVVLGAGGAARAACYALAKEGFKHIVVVNRSLERAQNVAAAFGGTAVAWEDRARTLEGADVLANATSLGMTGKQTLEIDLAWLPVSALVTDLVYAPLVTPLLKDARDRGNRIVDGLGMLLHQAVPGFEAWFGVRPVVDSGLRHAVLGGGMIC